eukprot:264646-Prymnesium_polylepis.1
MVGGGALRSISRVCAAPSVSVDRCSAVEELRERNTVACPTRDSSMVFFVVRHRAIPNFTRYRPRYRVARCTGVGRKVPRVVVLK